MKDKRKAYNRSRKRVALTFVLFVAVFIFLVLLPVLTVLVYQDNFGKRFETAEWMAYSADYFTLNGYLVFAYDATGCDKSESDAVGGLPQGVIDLDFALHYVKETEEYRDRGDYRVVTKRQDVGDIREDSLIKKCQKRG